MSDTTSLEEPQFLTVATGNYARQIAIRLRPADAEVAGPALVWFSGYRSDMSGTKAVELDGLAARRGLACVRFDYSGHGLSDGAFTDGTISRWVEEALAVLDHAAPRRAILVGSSMGGWIALRLAQELARRGTGPVLEGMVLIAPAPDFTSELVEPHLSEAKKASLSTRGYFEEPSEYSPEPNIYTRALIEDGRANRVLNGIIETGCPVHILQGMDDRDVPYKHALRLMEHLPADDALLTIVRDGDHRLSRPEDIERMLAAVTAMVAKAE